MSGVATRKVCKACHTEKELIDFPPYSGHPEWLMGICKDCKRLRDNGYSRKRNVKDREKVNARVAKWAAENREQDLARKRKYNREHRGELHQWHRQNYESHRDEILAYGKEHVRLRRRTDLDFRLTCVLRSRVGNALAGKSKSARTMELLGCSVDELKRHLEVKFKPGMTWSNHGQHGWHIDHIVPCCSFDLSKPEEQRKCFGYANLQPLWADENRKKHAGLVAA